QGAGALPADERPALKQGLAGLYARAGARADARRLYGEIAAQSPGDLGVRMVLFDLAVLDGDAGRMRVIQGEVRKIEGDEGPLWRYMEAACQLQAWLAGEKRADLELARQRLAEAAARRPGWSRVPLALGAVEEAEGNTDAAIEKYREAVRRGERDPQVVEKTAFLLLSRNRR